jgi:two-component system, NtrC family, response regulator GlrR
MDETVQRPMERPAAERPPPARLRFVFPRHITGVVRLGPEDVVIGRRPDAGERGFKLEDPTVSRRHFVVRWNTELKRHTGADLGSRNGSRIDGRDCTEEDPVPLEDGDIVRVGDVLTVYECGDAVESEDADEISLDAVPGKAATTVQLRVQVATAARDPSPILMIGETGTGKEFIAREIHRLSGRKGPLVAVNCAALSPQLIESQLFGHVKGAFTGADRAHEGLFRAAEGGTIFLDEIGELPRELQPKLLRVLQEREVLPVGETRPMRVDVRVISATLRDLTEMIDDGGFRLDLYARLSPWEIRVPPLRERRADLVEWIDRLYEAWYRQREAGGREPTPPVLEVNAVERLLLFDWPDNLRGLDRLVHRACSEGGVLDVKAPAAVVRSDRSGAAALRDSSSGEDRASPGAGPRPPKPNREELVKVLETNGGSVRATAKHFGRDRRQIYRWMEQYGLRDKGDDKSTD